MKMRRRLPQDERSDSSEVVAPFWRFTMSLFQLECAPTIRGAGFGWHSIIAAPKLVEIIDRTDGIFAGDIVVQLVNRDPKHQKAKGERE